MSRNTFPSVQSFVYLHNICNLGPQTCFRPSWEGFVWNGFLASVPPHSVLGGWICNVRGKNPIIPNVNERKRFCATNFEVFSTPAAKCNTKLPNELFTFSFVVAKLGCQPRTQHAQKQPTEGEHCMPIIMCNSLCEWSIGSIMEEVLMDSCSTRKGVWTLEVFTTNRVMTRYHPCQNLRSEISTNWQKCGAKVGTSNRVLTFVWNIFRAWRDVTTTLACPSLGGNEHPMLGRHSGIRGEGSVSLKREKNRVASEPDITFMWNLSLLLMLPAWGTHRNNYPLVLNYYNFFVGIKENSSLEWFAMWNVIVRCCSVEDWKPHITSPFQNFPNCSFIYGNRMFAKGSSTGTCSTSCIRWYISTIFHMTPWPKNRFSAHTTSSKTSWPKVYYIIFSRRWLSSKFDAFDRKLLL